MLVAQGWVYPTDSSINVAVGQGTRQGPYALSLEYQAPDGRWVVASPNLGFPAGKNKTMLIDLRPVGSARRVRLRTNMEVYWDALATAIVTEAPVRTQRLAASTADLRYRGFSQTLSLRDHAPETPSYAPVAATGQRWRDLVGFYTRFGDVRELIAGIDDRYVIMNAGDELALSFPVPAGATGRLDQRLRARRRRLGEGRRLQHRAFRDRPAAADACAIVQFSRARRARRRSGLPASPRRLGALSYAAHSAGRFFRWIADQEEGDGEAGDWGIQ